MPDTTLVVPCYDEAARLDVEAFADFVAERPEVSLVLVDDGSRDGTVALLQRIHERAPERVQVLTLPENRGKAEAVRRGMQHALAGRPRYAGYWDADLSTPLDALPRFRSVLEARPEILMVFGARVQLLGRSIRRRGWRHYAGRVFATAVSNLLDLPIYDSQCGAKLFRATPEVADLFARPFVTDWIFDCELLARLIAGRRGGPPPGAAAVIYEYPLERWHDVRGSKVGARGFASALLDLARLWRHYRPRAGAGNDPLRSRTRDGPHPRRGAARPSSDAAGGSATRGGGDPPPAGPACRRPAA